ncbi:hypothetical protein EJ06DRAFT_581400 [Trichodelitschia bisporula]|uniref:Uncharacterized protein n=1 Tax=Trichodelitschia bisporula TaxID=703511 RepID=A0A6G1HZC1_9PEZI|nr:hypothetical protein EJ06DRAFT_581400 [Trichodelitschia bisporula]
MSAILASTPGILRGARYAGAQYTTTAQIQAWKERWSKWVAGEEPAPKEPPQAGSVYQTLRDHHPASESASDSEPQPKDSLDGVWGLGTLTHAELFNYEPIPGAPRPPSISSTNAQPHSVNHLPPESLWSGDVRRSKARGEWSEKKLGMMELCVARLVTKLCINVDLHDQPPSNLLALPEVLRKVARLTLQNQKTLVMNLSFEIKHAQHLKPWERPDPMDLPIRYPKYSSVQGEEKIQARRQLNHTVKELFDLYEQGRLSHKSLVIRICQALLESTAAPTVHTWNLLAVGFAQDTSQHHNIADSLIELLLEIKLRPNELTCAIILRSFRTRKLEDLFAQFIGLMRGHGNGLMLANYDIKITPASSGRLTKKGYTSKILQAAQPNPLILREIIRGVLDFSGLEAAMDVWTNFNQNGWGLDFECCSALLLQCVKARDWERGMKIWAEVEELLVTGEEEPLDLLAARLAFTVACDRQDVFLGLYENSTRRRDWVDLTERTKHLLQVYAPDKVAEDGQAEGSAADEAVSLEPSPLGNAPPTV